MTEPENRNKNLPDKATDKIDETVISDGKWKRRFGFIGIFTLILITLTLQSLVSLSTAIIHPLDLIHAKLVPGKGDGIPSRISVGGSGGCMWFDDLSGSPAKCTMGIHFHPDPESLSLSEETDTILWALSARIGVWRISNFLATGLLACGLISFVLAIRFRRIRTLTSAIFYPATYRSVIWLWVASTILVSVTSCLFAWVFEPDESGSAETVEEVKEEERQTRRRTVNDNEV
ncbi:uncharacterized protein L199_003160 [Kwoniella botswanensis]|uniref:uncharacterized protein n=1 Tax=Kwoniella botswanensis TaxID=1268659 RepID=UPI00315C8A6F